MMLGNVPIGSQENPVYRTCQKDRIRRSEVLAYRIQQVQSWKLDRRRSLVASIPESKVCSIAKKCMVSVSTCCLDSQGPVEEHWVAKRDKVTEGKRLGQGTSKS